MLKEFIARLFLCGSTGALRTRKKISPFILSLSKGVIRTIAIANQKGVSIIAVVAAMLILSVMGVALVSMMTAGSDVSVNQLQSEKAFNIAAGGIEFTLAKNKTNIPNYSTNGTWIDLGEGEFKVDTPAYLNGNIAAGSTTIDVDSTAAFPDAGRITIGDDFGITYTGKNATQFTGASGGQAHNDNDSVYPAARITTTINAADCNMLPTIDVEDDTGGFNIKHSFFIDNEYFLCATKTQYQFQNCMRCYGGTSKAAHPSGGGNSYASQYILTSTGNISNILSSGARRVVRVSAGTKEE